MDLQEIVAHDVDNYPSGDIYRIEDDFCLKMGYVELQDVPFQTPGFFYGSNKDRQAYGITKDIKKYFGNRYFLFSQFDEGIQIDRESWYSVVAQPISNYLLQRLLWHGVKTVFQPFCGVGGISVHFAGRFKQLVVNDLDPNKVAMLRNNLSVYGKGLNHIKFMNKDVFAIQPTFKVDCVVVCPPWGGIDISEYASRDLDEIMVPRLSDILNHCRNFSENMILQMPKNTNLKNLLKVINMNNMCPMIRIEKILVDSKLSQLFIYIGNPKFTSITPSILNNLLTDSGAHSTHKEAKKQLRKKMSQGNFEIFQKIYWKCRPNKHIFL